MMEGIELMNDEDIEGLLEFDAEEETRTKTRRRSWDRLRGRLGEKDNNNSRYQMLIIETIFIYYLHSYIFIYFIRRLIIHFLNKVTYYISQNISFSPNVRFFPFYFFRYIFIYFF